MCDGFWLHFGAAVVMGGCGEELVVMPRTSVASSQPPFLSRISDLGDFWEMGVLL